MTQQFIILDPAPIVLDRDAHDAAEAERVRIEEARHDAFLSELLARKGDEAPVVRTL